MDAFGNYDNLDGEGIIFINVILGSNEDIVLLKIQILVATKSAESGISSNWLKYAKKKGIPSNFYEMVQELGRVDR